MKLMVRPIDEKHEELNALCKRVGVRRLDAFGSVVRGDFDPQTSDLDFLVEFRDLPPEEYAKAWFSLKEALEAMFRRPVDLITPNSLENPYFEQRVRSERRNLYAS